MRAREAGFTLLELVVAVGITVILLAAGGYWMLSMRPAALRGALDDFDANLATAKAIAASSGNGATLVFAPQPNGALGFTLRVYSGRPNAASAVSPTNAMIASSPASVSEAHFGKPPFAIFLNSAGYPTGSANYPTLDAQENPTFGVIAQQPPCPSGGIELTFTSPQGVAATRTLPCDEPAPIAAGADPTPTPNAPHISPTYLLAHYTTDSGPLKFKAAEYGYYHWYASTQNGAPCQTQASDTGAAPATFASPWPYAQPSPASQGGIAPAPPEFAPYTWPLGDPNDPPAWFQLSPVLHNGGMCTVTVADDFNQLGTVTVQVMGDLTPTVTSLSLTAGNPASAVGLSKTFDTQQLLLSAGGPCAGIVGAQPELGFTPAGVPSTARATASVAIAPLTQGACTLIVQDQYGEQVQIAINVASARQPFATWPASLVIGVNGAAVAQSTTGTLQIADREQSFALALGPVINALLDGGIARGASYTGPCYAQAFQSGSSGAPDTSLPPSVAQALNLNVASDGCILSYSGGSSASGVIAAYEPVGTSQTGNFQPTTPCQNVNFGSWSPNLGRDDLQALLPVVGATPGACIVDIADGTSTQVPIADAGGVGVTVTCAAGDQYVNGACYYLVAAVGFCETKTVLGVIAYNCSPPIPTACETGSDGCADYPYEVLDFDAIPSSALGSADGGTQAQIQTVLCTLVEAEIAGGPSWGTEWAINYQYTVSDSPSEYAGADWNDSVENNLGLGIANETEVAGYNSGAMNSAYIFNPADCGATPGPSGRPSPTPPNPL
jgi:type II secretory pathway pseudopilin PulG